MTQYLASSIVRTGGVTLFRDTPIRQAVRQLVEARAPAATVLSDNGMLEGILTQKDCFGPALHASYHQEWSGAVADYMTAKVICLDASHDLVRAAELFLSCPHRVLPVLKGGRPLGLLHRSDVLRLLSQIG